MQPLDRLDALQNAVWQKAMAGDVGAVRAAHKIVMSRCRLLALDKPAKSVDKFGSRSVVLSAAEVEARAAPVPEYGPALSWRTLPPMLNTGWHILAPVGVAPVSRPF